MGRQLDRAERAVRARRDGDRRLARRRPPGSARPRSARRPRPARARRRPRAGRRAPPLRTGRGRPARPSSRRLPRRAQATAWFAPLPPGTRAKAPPPTVSPRSGRRSTRTTRSRLTEPTTTTLGATAPSYEPCGRAWEVRQRRGASRLRFEETGGWPQSRTTACRRSTTTAPGPSRTSISRSRTASSWFSWDRPAAARRRRSACSPGSRRSARGRSGSATGS